ncbi:UxaA family hydrolase [Sporomusa acidovorans]|uniref:Altronate dehydratase n=1 Tax=Sporomusa acidovorans (strain ATCC 49682 / DSM 3132 / Mol) TaxID=1123286 RepID=A0ABZ3J8X1_SPOA4|nr:UxaA family hydrolase [Sporomusa acidovorans]OZC17524.1 altronate dehydratase [Sporomusa acidovorans DSM 3132]SDF08364.1 altronate dehydratase large subunit [Sporomusa acidovorans]
MNFMGYRRPDGTVGIRNHVLVFPTVNCANQVARGIASNVRGTTWVEHQHGCSQLGADAEQTARAFIGHGIHPNVYGIVVVGLGCEVIRAQDVAAEIKKQCPYKPVHTIIIQDEGGSIKAIQAGAAAAQKMVIEASGLQREPIDASELILGTECGGSDACSGLSGNPALGAASDLLIDASGTSILAETAELIGADHIIAERAINESVKAKCYATIRGFEEKAKTMGVDMRGSNPTPGNIEGGLSSIEEKSLGCVYKGGTRPLQAVIDWAEKVSTKGLVFMDTPGNDIEQLTGMVAGGCHICVFTTGRGTPTGSPIAPTIKVATNTALFEKMADNMDLNAGTIITGDETVQQVGKRIFEEMLAVASGKMTKAEVLGHNDFAIMRIGPTM